MEYITEPDSSGDGIRLFGENNPNHFSRSCIDFSDKPCSELDENISTINGCIAFVSDCVFSGGIKLALNGNGDFPERDRFGYVKYENCIFKEFGRRGPEAQDGVRVILENCIICNWGIEDRFDVRSFAGWAHSNANIIFKNCVFLQEIFFQSSLKNFFIDLGNHIGNDVNDKDFTWKTLLPGVCKGSYSSDGGFSCCIDCYKNKWWIYLENRINKMSKNKAEEVIKEVCAKTEQDAGYFLRLL